MSEPGSPEPTVRRDADAYVLELGGERVGAAFIRVEGTTVTFTHTEVDDAHAGQGLASRLIRAALDDVRSRDETIVPRCPFVAAYVERHPGYADLLA